MYKLVWPMDAFYFADAATARRVVGAGPRRTLTLWSNVGVICNPGVIGLLTLMFFNNVPA